MPEITFTIDTGSERFTEKYLMTDKEAERLISTYRLIYGVVSEDQPAKIDVKNRQIPQPPVVRDRTNSELWTHLCDNLHSELLKMIDHKEREEHLKSYKPLTQRKT